jgi:hypothetical protein
MRVFVKEVDEAKLLTFGIMVQGGLPAADPRYTADVSETGPDIPIAGADQCADNSSSIDVALSRGDGHEPHPIEAHQAGSRTDPDVAIEILRQRHDSHCRQAAIFSP